MILIIERCIKTKSSIKGNAKRRVARYKREYKRKGATISYNRWALDKGYASKPDF